MHRRISHIVLGLATVIAMTGSAIAVMPPHDESNKIVCYDCHALRTGTLAPNDLEQEAMCKSCHNPTGTAAAMSDVSNHIVHGGGSIVDCTSCHEPHGPQPTEDPHPTGLIAENLKLIRADTSKRIAAASEPALFQLRPEHFAFDDSNAPWNGICQSCHTQTKHHTNDASADHEHWIGYDCTACHRHENGFVPGDGLCTGCHSQQQGFRRQIVGAGGDFGRRSSHVDGTVDDEDCITCHEMDKHQYGVVRLKDLDNGGVWTGGRDEWCLSCHDGDPPADVVFLAEEGSGYDKSSFFNSTHDQHMGSNSCSHCHHVHGSPRRSLLKDTYVVADYNRASQGGDDYALCWKCHDRAGVLTGDNAYDRYHDKHVNREDAPCFICHDVHAPADADEPGLINLDNAVRKGYDVDYVDGYDASTAFGFMYELGYCYVTCHSKRHEPLAYDPRPGPATSCAPCHLPDGKFVHDPRPPYCSDCHWDDRAAPPHPEFVDCANCHGDPGGSWKGATYDHSPYPITCALCHEHRRPALPHPQGVDCTNCHTDPGGTFSNVSWDHKPTPSSCAACHEDTRPSDPHPQGIDCSSCHADPGGTFSNVSWDHEPTPSSCAACHESSRPSSSHLQSGDCSDCHSDPGGSWSGATMDHSSVSSSCDACHEGDRPSSPHVYSGDCSDCHSDAGGSWSGGSYDHDPPNPDCLSCHQFALNLAAIAPQVIVPDVNDVFFALNEEADSMMVADTLGFFVGMVNDRTETFWGDGLYHGDGAHNYVDFEYYDSFLQASEMLTIAVRIRPTGIGVGDHAMRILSRDSNRNYRLSIWRDSTSDLPDNVASIAFGISPVDTRGGSLWKTVLTDCARYPVLNDHWYLVKVVWNSDKTGGIPCDIFVDDEGIDGIGTEELWSGYRNATDSQQSQLPANRRLCEGNLIAIGDGNFTIGANVNNHAENNFIGEIDWIHWQARADYSDVDDPPD